MANRTVNMSTKTQQKKKNDKKTKKTRTNHSTLPRRKVNTKTQKDKKNDKEKTNYIKRHPTWQIERWTWAHFSKSRTSGTECSRRGGVRRWVWPELGIWNPFEEDTSLGESTGCPKNKFPIDFISLLGQSAPGRIIIFSKFTHAWWEKNDLTADQSSKLLNSIWDFFWDTLYAQFSLWPILFFWTFEPAVLWKTFSCCGFSSASPGTACTDVAPVPGCEENGRGGLVWAVHVVHICFDNDMIMTMIMMWWWRW